MKRFPHVSMGSACELEYQILFARDVGYILDETYNDLTVDILEVKRMLAALIKVLRQT